MSHRSITASRPLADVRTLHHMASLPFPPVLSPRVTLLFFRYSLSVLSFILNRFFSVSPVVLILFETMTDKLTMSLDDIIKNNKKNVKTDKPGTSNGNKNNNNKSNNAGNNKVINVSH